MRFPAESESHEQTSINSCGVGWRDRETSSRVITCRDQLMRQSPHMTDIRATAAQWIKICNSKGCIFKPHKCWKNNSQKEKNILSSYILSHVIPNSKLLIFILYMQMLFIPKVTYIAFKVCIWSIHALLGNWTHDLGKHHDRLLEIWMLFGCTFMLLYLNSS